MFSIHVENKTIYLNGNQEESAGTQLNGYVELYLTEPTRFKKLSLQFTGTLRLHWEEEKENKKSIVVTNKKVHRYKKTIFQNEWQFIDNPKWRRMTTQLESHMKHRYPFQMIIPGNISESMDAHPYGSLTYELKATAIKQLSLSSPSPSSNNITTYLPIHIFRIQPRNELFLNDMDDNREIQLSSIWEQKVNYHIQLNKKLYHRGEPIQIHFTFHPLAQGLKIRHLSCFLKEYTTIKLNQDNNQQQQHYTQNKIISLVRNDKFPCRGRNEWKNIETLIIPRSHQNSQLDLSHPNLVIEHKVKFTIHFVQMYGQLSQLHLTIPIKLCNESSSSINNNNNELSTRPSQIRSLSLDDLPRYEDACLSRPYDPHQWLTTTTATAIATPVLSPPYQEMDWDQEITTPEENNVINHLQNNNSCANNQIDDYFSYQPSNNNNSYYSHSMIPLQRVPSYETAIRSPF